MATTTSNTRTRTPRRLLAALAAGALFTALTETTAQAQEILLTGPLAGAPAVRKLRLYREGRIEVAPAASFTLLDEYRRTIMFGLRLNYNLTDWFAIGVWGAHGTIKYPTALSDHIQEDANAGRQAEADAAAAVGDDPPINSRLTAVNMSREFRDQLSGIEWAVAPQLTFTPFRGKISLFQSIYLDTDLYFFLGAAFVGLSERGDCEADCDEQFGKSSRLAGVGPLPFSPTFGLGFSFYVNKWNAIGFEWRALPFSWNPAGFDTAGSGKDEAFPDNKITDADRQFKFNQVLTVSYNFYFPQDHRVSE